MAVAENGDFSAASRKIKLSTLDICHQVHHLEQKLGVALFFRSTRSLALTSDGERMLEAAKRRSGWLQPAMKRTNWSPKRLTG